MSSYRRVVFGIDLHPDCDITVAKKAQALAKVLGAEEFIMVHGVEHVNSYGIGQAYPGILDIEGELVKAATEELAKVGEQLNILPANQVVALGSPKMVLFDVVKERNADLVIVGSHGRHGLSLLLGSTASSVLHNASCDVLAIRIRDDDQIC